MVVYKVFSNCVSYNYKSYLCSKATIVLIITSLLTVMFPVIFTYRSYGFWLRTDTYHEQPDISFKYDYILILDTADQENLTICSNLPQVLKLSKHFNYCPFIKAKEEDFNKDGYNDALRFTSHVQMSKGKAVYGFNLLLLFDYKLSSYCQVHMEVLAVAQHSSALSGSQASVTGDLSLVQRHPLNPRTYNTRYNSSVIPADSPFSLSNVLLEYSLRNLSAQLVNVYNTWSIQRAVGEPFVLDVTVLYPETTIRYVPSSWQVLRNGWAQFFPILFISNIVFRAVKNFIFSNQLVYTYREVPWPKSF